MLWLFIAGTGLAAGALRGAAAAAAGAMLASTQLSLAPKEGADGPAPLACRRPDVPCQPDWQLATATTRSKPLAWTWTVEHEHAGCCSRAHRQRARRSARLTGRAGVRLQAGAASGHVNVPGASSMQMAQAHGHGGRPQKPASETVAELGGTP